MVMHHIYLMEDKYYLLKFEKHEIHKTPGMNSGAPKGSVIELSWFYGPILPSYWNDAVIHVFYTFEKIYQPSHIINRANRNIYIKYLEKFVWRVSYKKQRVLTLHEHLGSPPIYEGSVLLII